MYLPMSGNIPAFSYVKEKTSYAYLVKHMCQVMKCVATPNPFSPVVITDMLQMVSLFMIRGPVIFWLDTPSWSAMIPRPLNSDKWMVLANTETSASAIRRSMRFNPEVLPYPIFPPDIKIRSFEERSGYITIGNNNYFDRKNLGLEDRVFRDLKLRKYLLMISNEQFADIRGMYDVDDSVKWFHLSSKRFYVALSRCEGQGMPVLESMAVGTPPIYVRAHAFKELIPDGVGVPIDPRNEDDLLIRFDTFMAKFHIYNIEDRDLVDALRRAESLGKEEYEDMSAKGREYVLKRFHWKVVMDKFDDYYHALMGKRLEFVDQKK